MTTDNWPVEFRYISRRLVQQILDQHRGKSGRKRDVTTRLGPPFASVEVGSANRSDENLYRLVLEATEAVADNTGTINDPGTYIRATLRFRPAVFPVHLGFDEQYADLASFFAKERLKGLGRSLIGLFGSATNFVGRAPVELKSGWYPSDAYGLYHLLNEVFESYDPKIRKSYLDDERGLSQRELAGWDTLEVFSEHLSRRFPREELTVLAKVHSIGRDVKISRGRYGLVMIGAPIWVATPEPAPTIGRRR